MVSSEIKQAISYLRSIDKSLGRIATALEAREGMNKTDVEGSEQANRREDISE